MELPCGRAPCFRFRVHTKYPESILSCFLCRFQLYSNSKCSEVSHLPTSCRSLNQPSCFPRQDRWCLFLHHIPSAQRPNAVLHFFPNLSSACNPAYLWPGSYPDFHIPRLRSTSKIKPSSAGSHKHAGFRPRAVTIVGLCR